jgi:hypothetical protein
MGVYSGSIFDGEDGDYEFGLELEANSLSQARAGLVIEPGVCRSLVCVYKNKPKHAQTKVSTKVDKAQRGKELSPT